MDMITILEGWGIHGLVKQKFAFRFNWKGANVSTALFCLAWEEQPCIFWEPLSATPPLTEFLLTDFGRSALRNFVAHDCCVSMTIKKILYVNSPLEKMMGKQLISLLFRIIFGQRFYQKGLSFRILNVKICTAWLQLLTTEKLSHMFYWQRKHTFT